VKEGLADFHSEHRLACYEYSIVVKVSEDSLVIDYLNELISNKIPKKCSKTEVK